MQAAPSEVMFTRLRGALVMGGTFTLFAAGAAPSHAAPGRGSPSSSASEAGVSPGASSGDPSGGGAPRRSRRTARYLSLGGAVGSSVLAAAGGILVREARIAGHRASLEHDGYGLIAVGAAGTLITPSLGAWYAGAGWLPRGLAVRGVGAGVGLLGGAAYVSARLCPSYDPCRPPVAATTVLVVTGAVIYLGGMVLDVVDAAPAADGFNARHITIAPGVVASASGVVPGLALAGTF